MLLEQAEAAGIAHVTLNKTSTSPKNCRPEDSPKPHGYDSVKERVLKLATSLHHTVDATLQCRR